MGILIGHEAAEVGPVDLARQAVVAPFFAAMGLLAAQPVDLGDDGAQCLQCLDQGGVHQGRVDAIREQGGFERGAAREQPARTDAAGQALEGVDQGVQLMRLLAQGLELFAEVALGARKAFEQPAVEVEVAHAARQAVGRVERAQGQALRGRLQAWPARSSGP